MKGKKLRQLGSAVAVIVLLAVCVLSLQSVVSDKSNSKYHEPFYSTADEYDVLVFGASLVADCVAPMELWHDFGIAAYNLAGHGNPIPTSYWVMHAALERAKPKLVVIDVNQMHWSRKYPSEKWIHRSFDAMPLGLTKLRAVWDIAPVEDRAECLLPFLVYHDRWDKLTADDFSRSADYVRRGGTVVAGVERNVEVPVRISSVYDDVTSGMQYLERMIGECRAAGIEVLLTDLTSETTERKQMEANTAYLIAERNDLNYLNLYDYDILDYGSDFKDYKHLNYSGAQKVTALLGEYIKTHYDIPDRRSEARYAYWSRDYEKCLMDTVTRMSRSASADTWLMFAANDEFDTILITDEAFDISDRTRAALFENLGIKTGDVDSGTVCIAVDGARRIYTLLSKPELYASSGAESALGALTVHQNETDMEIKLNGTRVLGEAPGELTVIVLRHGTESVLAVGRF